MVCRATDWVLGWIRVLSLDYDWTSSWMHIGLVILVTEGQHVGCFAFRLPDHGQPPQLWQATRMLHAVLALTGEGEAGLYWGLLPEP